MAIKSKFFLFSLLLVVGVVVLGTVSIWNLVALRNAAKATAAEYDAMDRAESTAVQVAWLRDVLRGSEAGTYRDLRYFDPIQKEVVEIVRELRMAEGVDGGDGSTELGEGLAAAEHLNAATQQSSGKMDVKSSAAAAEVAAAELEKVRQSLLTAAKLVPGSARRQITGAADRLLSRIEWTCLWLLIVLIISALIHYSQYRALVRPLLWLREEMRSSVARDCKQQITAQGSGEFKDLAALFNGLAKELAELYQNLEEKVIARSRELVRSERLASVGFLAAGVAHEINNPLTVISGYAELATKALARVMNGGDGDFASEDAEAEEEAKSLSRALDAQNIIRDEAFRCKEITTRLLSLARGGGDGRQVVRLDEVARQVTVLTKGLKNYRDRKVLVDFNASDPLEVTANPTEMKQILLNLIINALEAVPSRNGEVRVSGRRANGWVEVSIEDNGKGMSVQTLQNVFEPFFTAKRGVGEPGTGLGLSITHAIVENHGGQITAHSAGPGRGSRFTVSLPARAIVQSNGDAPANNGNGDRMIYVQSVPLSGGKN
ncbi:MAG TPA: ATP-binding protein [Tepidisphaeraceae bacterium]|jgi:signal transduction histidine kinase|nr:ATP-binding protein [Tepidisphaeraceae bacterium]